MAKRARVSVDRLSLFEDPGMPRDLQDRLFERMPLEALEGLARISRSYREMVCTFLERTSVIRTDDASGLGFTSWHARSLRTLHIDGHCSPCMQPVHRFLRNNHATLQDLKLPTYLRYNESISNVMALCPRLMSFTPMALMWHRESLVVEVIERLQYTLTKLQSFINYKATTFILKQCVARGLRLTEISISNGATVSAEPIDGIMFGTLVDTLAILGRSVRRFHFDNPKEREPRVAIAQMVSVNMLELRQFSMDNCSTQNLASILDKCTRIRSIHIFGRLYASSQLVPSGPLLTSTHLALRDVEVRVLDDDLMWLLQHTPRLATLKTFGFITNLAKVFLACPFLQTCVVGDADTREYERSMESYEQLALIDELNLAPSQSQSSPSSTSSIWVPLLRRLVTSVFSDTLATSLEAPELRRLVLRSHYPALGWAMPPLVASFDLADVFKRAPKLQSVSVRGRDLRCSPLPSSNISLGITWLELVDFGFTPPHATILSNAFTWCKPTSLRCLLCCSRHEPGKSVEFEKTIYPITTAQEGCVQVVREIANKSFSQLQSLSVFTLGPIDPNLVIPEIRRSLPTVSIVRVTKLPDP